MPCNYTTKEPLYATGIVLLPRTRATAWVLGKQIRTKRKDGSVEGLVLERAVFADDPEGKRESELVIGQ